MLFHRQWLFLTKCLIFKKGRAAFCLKWSPVSSDPKWRTFTGKNSTKHYLNCNKWKLHDYPVIIYFKVYSLCLCNEDENIFILMTTGRVSTTKHLPVDSTIALGIHLKAGMCFYFKCITTFRSTFTSLGIFIPSNDQKFLFKQRYDKNSVGMLINRWKNEQMSKNKQASKQTNK